MARKVTRGELKRFADKRSIEYDEGASYEEMREVVDIHECKQCGGEYLIGHGEYCSDGCEAAYISENF